MFTSKEKLDADIREMEYLTQVLKDAQNGQDYDRSIRIQGVMNDLELVRTSLKYQIKY
tara:strand:- start:339 stop:512 length:174 start_codon:yes stop_codon:yes gene_type:complete